MPKLPDFQSDEELIAWFDSHDTADYMEDMEAAEPMLVTGKRTNAVLISEEDWRAIHETLYLLAIPGMSESIREGMQTPINECSAEVEW